MESNWRFNIWDLGCTTLDTRLLARLRSEPGSYVSTNHPTFSPERANIVQLLPTGIWDFNATYTKPVYPSHFPYGFDVLPD